MMLPSDSFAMFTENTPDSSRPTVRYPGRESGYEGLDADMIERSDSVFPHRSEPVPDAWLDPLPLVSTAKWLEVLNS